jgi:predicted permease
MSRRLPLPILILLRLPFFRPSEEVVGDLLEEFNSGARSRSWLWRQVASSFRLRRRAQARGFVTLEKRVKLALLQSFSGDLRVALRMVRKNPGFTATAVIALALGIGVNVGIFTILNGVALKSLPVPEAGRVVQLNQTFLGGYDRNVHGSESMFSYAEYQYYRKHNRVLSGLTAYAPMVSASLGGERPQQLLGQLAVCNYFDVLGVVPALGRGLAAADCAAPGSSAVVVLSDALWRSALGADTTVIGGQIILNRSPFTVVGIAPPGFGGGELIPAAFWAPLTVQSVLDPGQDLLAMDNMSWLTLLGRIRPGVGIEQVRANLEILSGQIDRLNPGRTTRLSVDRATLSSRPEERDTILGAGAVILAAVGLVLLIACANVANLFLSRAAGRRKEFAIRLALGASRSRLIRHFLTESMLVSLLGGLLGSVLSAWSTDVIVRFLISHLPPGVPPLNLQVSPDLRVLGYALGVTLFTGIACGLAPAVQSSRPDLTAALKAEPPGRTVFDGLRWLRSGLVGIQVAVCMILLISAGLLMRGLYFAQTFDPGFETRNVSVISFDLRDEGYNDERAAALQRQVRERLAALPGVDGVAQARVTPLNDQHVETPFSAARESDARRVEFNIVSPEYFPLLNIPILLGRNFSEEEARSGAHVAVVTQAAARRFWPGQDPLGRILRQTGGPGYQIVGVARDARVSRPGESDTTYLYLPAGPKDQLRLQFLVRSLQGGTPTGEAFRGAVHAADPLLVVHVARLEDNLEFWRAPSRIVAALSSALGGLALLLASIGLYGMVSYAANRRTREIGIRMALGAGRREVMRLILRQGMQPAVIGSLAGIAASAAVSRVLSSMLFGVSPLDPVSFLFVPALLLSVAMLASWLPARRATRVDPVAAMRYE